MAESIVESSTEAVLNVAKTERIRVLHVDDDPAFLKVAKQCLDAQGEFEVDTASSVNEALEKLEKTDYDAVVSDYQMPDEDGLEFLKELRANGNNVPFIVFTGKGREEIAIKALNLGADRYLNKHGDPETVYCELAHAIHQAVDRRLAQVELSKREAKLNAILESSPEAITITDLDGNIVECNQATVDVHGGQSKEDFIGRNAFELIARKDRERAIQNLKKTFEQGSVKTVEYTLRTKDGREFPAELSASVVRNASGKPEYFVAITRDVTERKKAEEEVKSSEQKFRGLVEDSAAAIATIDLKGRLTYVNRALADSLGYSVQEMSGRAFKDFVHPDDRGRLVRLFLKIIVLRRKPRKFEFRALRKDGGILHLTCRPTRLETAGKTVGFQAIIIDNTAEKRMLEKAEKTSEKLSVVGGLTRHDVNNKLSTILNVSYLLKQKLRDNQSLELVKETESAVHQIEGLFEFARTYEKLGTEELAYVDAEKVFNEAARLFPSLKDIRIVNDCHGLTLFADSLLRQLFYNLIDNSLKHGEKVDQVRVHYEISEDHLKLIYDDDGIGIPKAEKDKIFKEGYGKARGHGLYLIKKMCEVYGWTIQETGKQGKGTQFTINMPKAKPDGKPPIISASHSPPTADAQGNPRKPA